MSETPANLGQVAPTPALLTDLYTVGASKRAVVSSVVACNRGARTARFRVAHAVGGLADATTHYLYYDEVIPPNKTFVITIGICAAAADVIRVQSDTGDVTFNIYGIET